MNFSKNHLRDKANSHDFRLFRRTVFKEYATFIKDSIQSNYDWSVKFIMWLRQYLHYIMYEKKFRPTMLPRYSRGQILLVNFGFRIGNELGGPHYAIVLDNDNRKKDGLITVVPMISKKPRHEARGLCPWEYELPFPISHLILTKASKQLSTEPNSELVAEVIASANELLKYEPAKQMELIPSFLEQFEKNLQGKIAPLVALAKKMQKGSIVDTRQVASVSKQRIIVPANRADELYDVIIPESVLAQICDKIKNTYMQAGSLDESGEKL